MMSNEASVERSASEPRQVEAIILAFLRDRALGDEADALDVDDNLLTSGLVDSVTIVRLIGHVEERIGVSVPPTDMVPENFRTIRAMAAYLSSLLDG